MSTRITKTAVEAAIAQLKKDRSDINLVQVSLLLGVHSTWFNSPVGRPYHALVKEESVDALRESIQAAIAHLQKERRRISFTSVAAEIGKSYTWFSTPRGRPWRPLVEQAKAKKQPKRPVLQEELGDAITCSQCFRFWPEDDVVVVGRWRSGLPRVVCRCCKASSIGRAR